MDSSGSRSVSRPLTVGIATRNRLVPLERALCSLVHLKGLIGEVIVADCGYETPLSIGALESLIHPIAARVKVLHVNSDRGYIAGRNDIAASCTTDWLLSMDDDSIVINRESVARALDLASQDPRVASVGFAQGNERGEPYPSWMQPSTSSCLSEANSYIGYGVLHRVATFRRLGGYWEPLCFYGEEKDYCWRVRAEGCRVIYSPTLVIGHLAASSGRDNQRYLRFYTRNDCMTALRLFPWPLALYVVMRRFTDYGRVSSATLGRPDREGLGWIRSELSRLRPQIMATRTSVGFKTVFAWHRNRKHPNSYTPQTTGGQ